MCPSMFLKEKFTFEYDNYKSKQNKTQNKITFHCIRSCKVHNAIALKFYFPINLNFLKIANKIHTVRIAATAKNK